MPYAAPVKCGYPGCREIVPRGRCQQHSKRPPDNRESAARRGYGRAWQRASKAFLMAHPLCQCSDCMEGAKRLRPAEVVDHIIPHKGNWDLFWDRDNWQAMATVCHNAKTAKESGFFGKRYPGAGKKG